MAEYLIVKPLKYSCTPIIYPTSNSSIAIGNLLPSEKPPGD